MGGYMNKEKARGFMMAELIIVSAVVLTVLIALYANYNKLYSKYHQRLDYFDSSSVYFLVYYRDILIGNNRMNDILSDLSLTNPFIKIYDSQDEGIGKSNYFRLQGGDIDVDYNHVVYIAITNDKKVINGLLDSEQNVNQTYKDYVNDLSSSELLESNYVMFLERCKIDDNDDCKYSYLEVYDGYE